ncbi:DUF853 family protein [Sinorhizobium medicae]|nr:DUF853 family protein [Sinorhizobium medicae]
MTYSLTLGATDSAPVAVPAKFLNRHGLITGATGTGKSVSLMGMAEAFQRLGVPSIVTDVKGDLSGLAAASSATTDKGRNIAPWYPEAAAVRLWDVFATQGEPLRASIADMGAPLAARALGLSDAQCGVLEVAFAVAADEGVPLHTLADLRDVVTHCSDNRATVGTRYGLVTPSSVAGIGRAILRLERGGGAEFFDGRAVDVREFLNGRTVHLLDCVKLIREPRLYGAVLLWLLDALGRVLPEVGDCELPKLALFFDEAHLLFTDCPPDVLRAVEQTVRLIRSKGVGVYFASQSPSDVPDGIARQLSLRVQHALRAVTPRDRGLLRAAADSLPAGVGFKVHEAIGTLPPGDALVTFMGADGKPTATQIVHMQLPRCRLSPLSDTERAALMAVTNPIPKPVTQPLPIAPVKPQPLPTPARPHGGRSLHWLEKVGLGFGLLLALIPLAVGLNAFAIGHPLVGVVACVVGVGLWAGLSNIAMKITRPARMPTGH